MNNQQYKEMLPFFEGTEIFDIPEENNKIPFEINGQNLQHTLVICDKEPAYSERELLNNILTALKLKENDIALICLNNNFVNFASLKQKIQIERMVVFGVKPAALSLRIQLFPNKVVKLNRVKMIFTDDLTSLNNNKSSKAALWNSLQQMFNN